MVINVSKIRAKRRNGFMTDKEVEILWKHCMKWSDKWMAILGFALFRGMRIGEIVACNLYDFQNENFHKLNIVLEKSHIGDEFPLLNEFNILLKKYINNNRHTMKNGYLFPFYNTKKTVSHMNVNSAIAMFAKIRKEIGKDHPQFLDKTTYLLTKYLILKYINEGIKDPAIIAKKISKNQHNIRDKISKLKKEGYLNLFNQLTSKGKEYISEERYGSRHRISWHSCRRWFETRIWNNYKDKMMLRDIMRYQNSKVVDVYIDSYEVWKNESTILEDTFSSFFQKLSNVQRGQTKLQKFF